MQDQIYVVPGSRVTGITKQGEAFKIEVSPVNPYLFRVVERRRTYISKRSRYPQVYLGSDLGTREVHMAMALTFMGEKPVGARLVRHLNDNPIDNRLENLAWGTDQDNSDDREQNGKTFKKLTKATVEQIVRLHSQGKGQTEIGKLLGLSPSHVNQVMNGTLHRAITGLEKKPVTRRKVTPELMEQIATLINEGWTEREITKKLKCSSRTVTAARQGAK